MTTRSAQTQPERPARQLRTVSAIALGGRLDFDTLQPPTHWERQRAFPYGRSYGLPTGETLYLFRFGAAVCEGAERIQPPWTDEILRAGGPAVLPDTHETYFIHVDPHRTDGQTRVGWDRVVIPELRPELLAAIALLLAQSVALERYEHAADALLDQTLELSRDLARRGRLPIGTRGLIERVGRLTGDRLELARWFYLVDRPEETWEDHRVARLYDDLFANLELRQRHDAMLYKLGAAEHATQTALELWHGRRSNALEWAIVLLIIVEIVFGTWGLL